MTEPIRGKIAAVLNEREIALNIGSAKGVSVGMYFDVMSLESGDIIDPDTKDVLGSIERSKVRVRVTEVQEKISVASTYRSERVNVGGTFENKIFDMGPFARALMPPKWITKHETLKASEKNFLEALNEEDSYVQVGDPVCQVLKERYGQAELKDVNG